MSLVQRFEKNESGRDFVVGDIHGCFDELCGEMDRVEFDPARDRIFSVGDLVDRGPLSADAINWIGQDWFHAVRGNHEQMAIGVAAGRHDLANYLQNGGGWFLSMEEERQQRMAAALDTLPLCIEVDTASGLVGIVHADIAGNDWKAFTDQVEAPRSNNHAKSLAEFAMWSRDRIREMDESGVEGVALMFVGHTPVKQPTRLGNVCYIDTGCVFGRALTMLQINGEPA
ncbi:metallophosphoesterase [Stenotrophomonas maltophilia]|uniref:metallophosphoesterase n=1 Tax=Stenotrophomonas maltophilia TaxID=40324 RepID=UPI0015DF16CD|nr:metallophosphoesterase [Stenotrophomonas maltophilia]MBA0362387.1 serine/threonine protein phosphatase [Stenotrophomonas maltophilia]